MARRLLRGGGFAVGGGSAFAKGHDDGPTYECPTARFGVGFCPPGETSAIPPLLEAPASYPLPAPASQLAVSPDGLLVVVLAGEIYNAHQLHQKFSQHGACSEKPTTSDNALLSAIDAGRPGHGHIHGSAKGPAMGSASGTNQSAAEVLLHLYRRLGRDMLGHLRGRFAMATYDAKQKNLLLARDRLGEKPLWYAWLNDRLVFATEGKALAGHPAINRSIRPQAIVEYALLGYIPHPGTLYDEVYKLSPGNVLECEDHRTLPRRYWRPSLIELPTSPAERAEWVRHRIEQAVELRMEAGGPVGALLSGGVDSAIVTALMVKRAGRSGGVKTFTAGFSDKYFDERTAARRLAEYLGTQHTELLIEPDPATMLDRTVALHDEPFGDSSTIPTFLICQAARQHVTVAITGDGGDEIFGGYDRYRAMMLAERMTPRQYLFVRIAANVARLFASNEERSRLRRLIRFSNGLTKTFASQYFSYRALFQEEDIERLFTKPFAETVDLTAVPAWFTALYEGDDDTPEFDNEVARAQHHDLMTYLPDDLLVKSDTASTANALDLRAPLLDHDLIAIGLSLPPEQKIKNRRGKAILRELFADCLPPGHLEGTKRGFGVPLGDWLRNELAGPLRETLLDKSFLDRGLFKPTAIYGLVNDHLSGRDDHRHRLWALMVLAKWLEQNG